MQALTRQQRGCARAAFSQPSAARRTLVISAAYKNKENIDLSRVGQFMRSETDTGSSEAQVARLSARVAQISSHMAKNRKDYAAKRGLEAVLAQRKSLLEYLFKTDRDTYDRLLAELKIKSVATVDTRGAARNKDDKAAA